MRPAWRIPALQFMQHFSFADSLWFGEGFDYWGQDAGPPSRPDAYSSRFHTMANGGSRRGLYGEERRTAVAAATHSPPHVQRSSLALVIEAGGGSEAGRGSEEVETKEKTKKFPSRKFIFSVF